MGLVELEGVWTRDKLAKVEEHGQEILRNEVALEHGSLPQGQDTVKNS